MPLRRTVAVLAALVALTFSATALARHRQGAHAAAPPGSAALIVQLAERELARGVHEVPDGSNRSPDIRRYDRATVGSVFGAPWCAYFASYVAKQAGAPIGYGGAGIGYVPYIRAWAKATGRSRRTPKPGYLITFPEHVGIVEHVYSNHTLSSIEGNAGNAVRREYHTWSEAVSYVKIAADDGGAISTNQPHPPPTTVRGPLRARIHAYPSGDVAAGENVDFTSQDSSGNPVRETWSFGEHRGVDATGENVSHTFAKPGRYTVTLRLTDRRGRHSAARQTINVHPPESPQPQLSLDNPTIHPGDTVNMDASGSSSPNGDIARYEWDFLGNGNFVAGDDTASYTYTTPGTYTVRVRVTDDTGLQAEADRTVTVLGFDPPVASVGCDNSEISAGDTLNCSSDDSASPFAVTKHEWDINGDGNYDLRGKDVSFSYSRPGYYRIHLRVTDEHGNTGEADTYVKVDDAAPTASFTHPTVKLNTPATFDGSASSDIDGQIARWEWDAGLGAGFQPGGPTFTQTYTQPGWHDVTLRVTDNAGLTDETDYWFYVRNHAPVAVLSATPTSAVHGSTISFDGTHSYDPDAGDSITKWQWDFLGNGHWTTGASTATYTYANPGTYYAKLKVTDRYGATKTAQVTIVVS
jgi:PKD repeat protein